MAKRIINSCVTWLAVDKKISFVFLHVFQVDLVRIPQDLGATPAFEAINPFLFTKNKTADSSCYYEGIIIRSVKYLADRIVFTEKGPVKNRSVSIFLIESVRVGKRLGKLSKKRYSQVV